MSKFIKHPVLAQASIAIFSVSVFCSVGLLLYAGLLSGWNWALFVVLAGRTLFLIGFVLPVAGIWLARRLSRAPTHIEEALGGVLLLICWLSSLYVIYITGIILSARL